VTAEFRLNYRRPAPVERPLVVRGRLVRTDGRDVYLEGEIIGEGGETLTTAEARWRRIERRSDSSGSA
jgi:acyl-coenzyme A thioesterase PaaI-like protein